MAQHPRQVEYQANTKGQRYGIRCKYEWDTSAKAFAWKFFRRGVYLGKTTKQDKVLPLLEKYCA